MERYTKIQANLSNDLRSDTFPQGKTPDGYTFDFCHSVLSLNGLELHYKPLNEGGVFLLL